jgi:hypothetical protein
VLLMPFVNEDKTQLKGIDLTKDIFFFETADGVFGMCAPIADDYDFHDFITRLSNIGGVSEIKHEKDINYCFYKNQWAIMYSNHCLLVMGPTMASKQAQEKIISRMQAQMDDKEETSCQGANFGSITMKQQHLCALLHVPLPFLHRWSAPSPSAPLQEQIQMM